MLDRLPPLVKNFYFITAVLFLFFMLFISDSNIIRQYRLTSKLNELENQKEFYTKKIKEVESDREELMSNEKLLEKFAREKYLMKKESEDLYVIVEE